MYCLNTVCLRLSLSVKVLYYAMNTTAVLLFFRIARKWKLIVRCWHEKEMVFLKKPYSYQKLKLSVKVNRMLCIVLFFTGFGKCILLMSREKEMSLVLLYYSRTFVLPIPEYLGETTRRRLLQRNHRQSGQLFLPL
jgi:Trehalose receptor